MKLVKGDQVLTMMVAREIDGDLFVLTENGYAKRTALSEYKKQKRGGIGVKTVKITEKKGRIVAAGILKDEHDVIIITNNGILIRIPAKSINRTGRATQGVKAMNVSKDDNVVSYAIVVSEN
jgi:DNA gyrase subunit A